jgi:hypothetical protein
MMKRYQVIRGHRGEGWDIIDTRIAPLGFGGMFGAVVEWEYYKAEANKLARVLNKNDAKNAK